MLLNSVDLVGLRDSMGLLIFARQLFAGESARATLASPISGRFPHNLQDSPFLRFNLIV